MELALKMTVVLYRSYKTRPFQKCSADLLRVRVLDDSGSCCYHFVSVVDFCYEAIVRIICKTCSVLPQHIRPLFSLIEKMTFATEVG